MAVLFFHAVNSDETLIHDVLESLILKAETKYMEPAATTNDISIVRFMKLGLVEWPVPNTGLDNNLK